MKNIQFSIKDCPNKNDVILGQQTTTNYSKIDIYIIFTKKRLFIYSLNLRILHLKYYIHTLLTFFYFCYTFSITEYNMEH